VVAVAAASGPVAAAAVKVQVAVVAAASGPVAAVAAAARSPVAAADVRNQSNC